VADTNIIFDDDPPPPIDRVSLAIVPTDAYSGRIVTQKITASLKIKNISDTLPIRPRRNLTGLLVFVNLPTNAVYEVKVEAQNAGYFDPDVFDFQPLPDSSTDAGGRRKVVLLFRKPEFPFENEATLVSGVVQFNHQPAMNALFEVTTEPGSESFKTKTDQRGAFTLAMRLPALDEPNNTPVSVEFKITHPDGNRQFNADVLEGRRNIFTQPIELSNSNVPPLIASA
jgi:hypothetical protein